MGHQGHGTTELRNRTDVFGQLFVLRQLHVTLADDQRCTQSWVHHFDEPLLRPRGSVSQLFQTYIATLRGIQKPHQYLRPQKTHCARHEIHEPQCPRTEPKQLPAACSDCQGRPQRGEPLDEPIRLPMLRKMWLQCRQKNSCHLSCHLCV